MTWAEGDVAVDPHGHRYAVIVDERGVRCKEIMDRNFYYPSDNRFRPYEGAVHPAWKREEMKG